MLQFTNTHWIWTYFGKQTGIKLDYFNKFDDSRTWIEFWQNGVLSFLDRSVQSSTRLMEVKYFVVQSEFAFFCLFPSKHRCFLAIRNFFAHHVYTKCIYNSRYNAGCDVKNPVSVNTVVCICSIICSRFAP